MPDADLTALTLADAATQIAARELSPVELTEACIARVEALDGDLHAFFTPTFERARAEAKAAADEIGGGKLRGPLHGIPFALKDLYETAGVRTTAGSRLREHYLPSEDATVVRLLSDAGVALLGKLNMHEWALGATNVNAYFPSPRNPWDRSRITGGSSGGSGVAVATSMALGALGSDTGGSIRIPAALCGISGLKPTYGRVSLRGVVPLAWSLDHAGPMARTALDCALILQTIAGFDPGDPASVDAPVPSYTAEIEAGVRGLRVGVVEGYFFDADVVEVEVASTVRAGAAELGRLGASVSSVDLPDVEKAAPANRTLLVADAAAYHAERLAGEQEKIASTVLARLRSGASITGPEYAVARRFQAEFSAALGRLFREVDLLLLPTTPIVAPPLTESDTVAASALLTRNTAPFNFAGVPAISVPCGFSRAGLPVGMTLVGAAWQEPLVLRAAHAYQRATDWHARRPPLDVA